MRQTVKGLLCLTIISTTLIDAANVNGKTYLAARSQSINSARELVGWASMINKHDKEEVYGAFTITPEYTRTWKSDKIGEYFSFTNSHEMTLSTSSADHTINAENFGLGITSTGTVHLHPRIQNFVADFELYLGAGKEGKGAYFKAHTPVVWSKWDMRIDDKVTAAGNLTAGKFAVDATVNTSLVAGWKGTHFGGDGEQVGSVPDLKYAIIDGKQTKTCMSDFEMQYGYNFFLKEKGHFGLHLLGVLPIGNLPHAKYVFEPVVGCPHWRLGGGFTSHMRLWDNENNSVALYLDGNISHAFERRMLRTYALKTSAGVAKPGSQYIVIKEFPGQVEDYSGVPTVEAAAAPTHDEYNAHFHSVGQNYYLDRVANRSTLDTDVSICALGDLTAMFEWKWKKFSFDLGYNFYGRTKETLNRVGQFPEHKFGFMGGVTGDYISTYTNMRVSTDETIGSWGTTVADPYSSGFIVDADLDETSPQSPAAMEHKVFGNMQYVWQDTKHTPFLGLGGEGTFSGSSNKALSYWGVWIKGGLTF